MLNGWYCFDYRLINCCLKTSRGCWITSLPTSPRTAKSSCIPQPSPWLLNNSWWVNMSSLCPSYISCVVSLPISENNSTVHNMQSGLYTCTCIRGACLTMKINWSLCLTLVLSVVWVNKWSNDTLILYAGLLGINLETSFETRDFHFYGLWLHWLYLWLKSVLIFLVSVIICWIVFLSLSPCLSHYE